MTNVLDNLRFRRAGLAMALAIMVLGPAAAPALTGAQAAAPAVAVFPSPGTHYNLPASQIAFRGISPSAIGQVQVAGSSTGGHSGRLAGDSDGQGASFLPDKPFAAGETVTVTTHLNVRGGTSGKFSFGIGQSAGPLAPGKLPLVKALSNGVAHYRSRPDLQPAAITVTKNSAPASDGDFFIAPQFGPAQDGPEILDAQGNPVWFLSYPVSRQTLITDFRLQNLYGQPVLTWWQGNTNNGYGRGQGIIFDRNYRQIAVVKAANGLDADLHEFMVTPQGYAYLTAASPVHLPGVGKPAIDAVVQEIDIRTGLVLFEWHALDHIPTSTSYFTPQMPGHIYDPYHLNSVAVDSSGNLLLSMRDTSAVYDVDHQTGSVIWTLGGKSSKFRMGASTSTWGQHDATVQPDGTITLFDDGAGPPRVHKYSRGVRERLDTTHMTATLVREYNHAPGVSSNFEGSTQPLASGNVVLGWGQQPYFSEDNAAGQEIFDAQFNQPTSSYRAYRFPWSAQPPTQPALAVAPNADGSTNLYASWNGATDVASWRVLAGPGPTTLTPVGTGAKRGFETTIALHSAAPYFAVQALASSGQVLSTSPVTATPAHIAAYGRSIFVSGSGTGGVAASCFANHPCHISTTVTAGRTVIARSGTEYVAQNSAGVLYFQLSPAGRTMLRRARSKRLPVTLSEHDSSGTTAASQVNLVPFSTSGSGPRRSVSRSGAVHFLGLTDFVSSTGVGGILAVCAQPAPCHATTTISVGRTVIARTGSEFLGSGAPGGLLFSLTSAGRSLLARAAGNQLGAQVAITSGRTTTTAQLALVRFS
jgi:hypothetical protein